MNKNPVIDVAAAIILKDDYLLIAQRPKTDVLTGLWEFPGGKIEAGETPTQCLRREIMEELNLNVTVGAFFAESIYQYPTKNIRLLCYWATYQSGQLECRVHQAVKWCNKSNLVNYPFAPADIPVVKKLLKINV